VPHAVPALLVTLLRLPERGGTVMVEERDPVSQDVLIGITAGWKSIMTGCSRRTTSIGTGRGWKGPALHQ
jgi:hypothetical protein